MNQFEITYRDNSTETIYAYYYRQTGRTCTFVTVTGDVVKENVLCVECTESTETAEV